jgi:hypothetical protein
MIHEKDGIVRRREKKDRAPKRRSGSRSEAIRAFRRGALWSPPGPFRFLARRAAKVRTGVARCGHVGLCSQKCLCLTKLPVSRCAGADPDKPLLIDSCIRGDAGRDSRRREDLLRDDGPDVGLERLCRGKFRE